MTTIFLKKGREKSLLRKHPWIFSGSIESVNGSVSTGETVSVLDNNKNFLAWGAYSPSSQIRVRVWDWDEENKIDEEFFRTRIAKCIASRNELRKIFRDEQNTAYRLINGESDGLPGLIVDVYSDSLVVQFLSAGVEFWRSVLIDLLEELTGYSNIIERSDVDVRKLENLPLRSGLLKGRIDNGNIMIRENGINYWVDLFTGHKTGFYLDQNENRRIIKSISANMTVLDCFCYTGGFTCSAAMGDAASITAVDASEDALNFAKRNAAENNIDGNKINFINGDVFIQLRKFRDQNKSFDLIVLDPPKFAQSSAQIAGAARGYKDINLLALKLLNPGGYLATFSCSGVVTEELFQKIVAGAALDAGVTPLTIKRLYQNYDHPINLEFPEGAYLKGLLLKLND